LAARPSSNMGRITTRRSPLTGRYTSPFRGRPRRRGRRQRRRAVAHPRRRRRCAAARLRSRPRPRPPVSSPFSASNSLVIPQESPSSPAAIAATVAGGTALPPHRATAAAASRSGLCANARQEKQEPAGDKAFRPSSPRNASVFCREKGASLPTEWQRDVLLAANQRHKRDKNK
jgi:hypothetical protein